MSTTMSSTRSSRRPTSHDVAKLAGVSQPTVSVVLSGRAREVGISEKTEARILAAARQLSYVPNRLMRSIRNGSSGILGVFGPEPHWSMSHSYWSGAVAVLYESAAHFDRELLLLNPRNERSLDETLARMLNGLIDGLIVQQRTDTEVLDRLILASIPLLIVGGPYKNLPYVSLDHAAGVNELVQHLYDRGHRRFCYMRVESPDTTRSMPYIAAEVRPAAYHSALQSLGLSPEDNPVIYEGGDLSATLDRIIESKVTAVICHNDEGAYPLIAECDKRGVRLPDDLAIAGFDGIAPSYTPTPLTTMRAPLQDLANACIEKLLALISGQEVESATFNSTLVVGKTT